MPLVNIRGKRRSFNALCHLRRLLDDPRTLGLISSSDKGQYHGWIDSYQCIYFLKFYFLSTIYVSQCEVKGTYHHSITFIPSMC